VGALCLARNGSGSPGCGTCPSRSLNPTRTKRNAPQNLTIGRTYDARAKKLSLAEGPAKRSGPTNPFVSGKGASVPSH